MKRFLFSMVLFSLLVARLSYAAGLGAIQINSGLGQPLDLASPVLNSASENVEEFSARVTVPENYLGVATDIKQALRVNLIVSDRDAFVEIKTNGVVNETIIPLQVELARPNGKLSREYMVLLNPPQYSAAISTNSTDSSWVNATRVNRQQSTTQNSIVIPIDPQVNVGLNAEQAAAATHSSPGLGSRLIIVQPGDTLASIVNTILPQGATRFQGMIAVYELNQNAFVDQNIHLIRSGAELTVPPDSTIFSYPRVQAKSRFDSLASRSWQLDNSSNVAISENQEIPEESGQPGISENQLVEAEENKSAPESESPSEIKSVSEAVTESFSLQILPAEVTANDSIPAVELNQQTLNSSKISNSDISVDAMQSFATSLELMSVSLSALQAENQNLKARLSNLETKMALLIQFIPEEQLENLTLQDLSLSAVPDPQSGIVEIQGVGGEFNADSSSDGSSVSSSQSTESVQIAGSSQNPEIEDMIQEQLITGVNNQAPLEISADQAAP